VLVTMGPTLFVDIGFDKDWHSASGVTPVAGIERMQALVDTGASECCIDALLATQVGLPIVDRRPIAGVGGKHLVNIYLAQIHVPSLRFTIWGAFAGVALSAGGQVHSALIGRTFLKNFTMVYEGRTGTVTIHNE
jgi:predicted aspartyl protease